MGFAVFGGPHGALGAWPWMLQLPGILLVFIVPGDKWFVGRVLAMFVVQLTVWYSLLWAIHRWRGRRPAA